MKPVEPARQSRQFGAMQIAYHIGAHCTDDDRLLGSLRKNTDSFADMGIQIPAPSKYRNLLRETIQGLRGGQPTPGTRDRLLDQILGSGHSRTTDRVILSNPLFICVVKRIFENQLFYHLIDEKLGGMRALFPDDEIEYSMALRNPATFIPAVYAQQTDLGFDDFMRGSDPTHIRWTHVIERLRRTDPAAKITLWADEDTPLFWAQLIRELAGVDPMTRIKGGFDQLQHVITADGMDRFIAYMQQKPPQTEAQKRRVIAAFLERFSRPDVAEFEIDLPGWDQDLIDRITGQYYQDLDKISAMDGVRLITP